MTLRARPPAKLNLTLAVGARQADGFHSLASVFVRIGLADELAVDFAADATADELTIDGDFDCPIQGNLVLRAFDLVRSAVGQRLPPLAAHLVKRIPVGAGLAGGSSDGAAALVLAQRAWGVGLAPGVDDRLQEELGSDVPFFARGGQVAMVGARGNVVEPVPEVAGDAGVLLCVSQSPLATSAVFARFDERRDSPTTPAQPMTDELTAALARGLDGAGLAAMSERLGDANDLWPAAADLAPELVERRATLESLTGRPWLLTGSGPTLFAIYPSPQEAQADGRRLADSRSAALSNSLLIATDVDGRTPTWRHP